MRRTAGVLAALASVAVAGCDGGGDSGAGAAPTTVTTTRVQVVDGIGRGGGFDPEQIYERLAPGVVTVLAGREDGGVLTGGDGESGQGSGFVVDGEGHVVTNAHVVTLGATGDEGADRVFVEFADGNRVPAEVVGVDLDADIALLKVEPRGLSLTPLPLGSSDGADVGEPVAAIGSPFGARQSLSIGVISALDRNIESLTRFRIGDAIQTDAAINPGNSGGPLLDARGRVLGVNAQILSRSGGGEGVGFAIPVDVVARSVRELRRDGEVDYGYLGVSSFMLWPQLADRLGIDAEAGALIESVEDGSPAEEAGLRAGEERIEFQGQPEIPVGGDVVVAVDDIPLSRTTDLADAIAARAAGERVDLVVLRDGRRVNVRVELGRRTDEP